MVDTPWGDSKDLRDRRLRPGGAQSREEAAENQRRRIYGAVVASTAERGYQGTRLEDVVEISGISMRSFYRHFPDKEAAFTATLEVLLRGAVDRVFDPGPKGWGAGRDECLDALAERFEAQIPAARMCLVEAPVAGPRAAALLEEEIRRAEDLLRSRMSASPGRQSMPPELASAAVGAVLEVLRGQLMRRGGRLEDVPGTLLSLLFEFEPPTRPLRSAARAPELRPEASEASDHAERAVRAFEALLAAERYEEVTMEQVAKRAKMSRRTLYANFSDRERLLSAAIDSACAQVTAVTLPALHRHDSPVEGLRASIEALLAFLASRPNLAHLLLVAIYEGGEPALRRRARGLRPLRSLLGGVSAASPGSALTIVQLEAVLGGLLGMMRRRMLEAGSAGLVGLGPICTYVVLAPVVGPEQATTAAEGRAYRRPSPSPYATAAAVARDLQSSLVLMSLGEEPKSAAEIARESGVPLAKIEAVLAEFLEAGVVNREEHSAGDRPLYLARWPLTQTTEWAQIGRAEREAISMELMRIIEIEVEEAFATGTFDSRLERHLVRIPAWLDEQGWQEAHAQLVLTTHRLLEIDKRARERLEAAGEEAAGFAARIVLVSFEAPQW